MYSLSSAEMSNEFIKESIVKNKNRSEEIRNTASIEKIQFVIFNEDGGKIEENLYRTIVASLTLADELRMPFSKNIADILYFALCANYDDKIAKVAKIRNINQANILYKLYENDYSKIELEDERNSVRFTELKGKHSILFPGFHILWKLPVSFFKAGGKSNTTLSGLAYCLMIVNSKEHKIPRSIYIKFFKESLIKGRLICESTDELKTKFNLENKEVLKEVFNYCGFAAKRELQDIVIPLGIIRVEDEKIVCSTNESFETISIYWKPISDSTYILLPKYGYIPLKNNDFNLVSLLV